MVEAVVEDEDRRRRERAVAVQALVKGFRERRPNMRQIFRIASGERRVQVRSEALEEFREMLEESNARVRAAAKEARNGGAHS